MSFAAFTAVEPARADRGVAELIGGRTYPFTVRPVRESSRTFFRRPDFKTQKLIALIGTIFFITFFGLISIGLVASHDLQVAWFSLVILIIVPPIMLLGDALFQGPEFISFGEKGLTLIYTGIRSSEILVAWSSVDWCIVGGVYVTVICRTPYRFSGFFRENFQVKPEVFSEMKPFVDPKKVIGKMSS